MATMTVILLCVSTLVMTSFTLTAARPISVHNSSRSLQSYTYLDFLNPHNSARKSVNANPALPALSWSNSLANQAQQWANTLYSEDNCAMQHGDYQNVGQNLAWSGGLLSPEQAVQLWVNERSEYRYAIFQPPAAGCGTGNWEDCGHWTQMIWRATTQVGCGGRQCANGNTIVVCDYYPAGNVVGQYPY